MLRGTAQDGICGYGQALLYRGVASRWLRGLAGGDRSQRHQCPRGTGSAPLLPPGAALCTGEDPASPHARTAGTYRPVRSGGALGARPVGHPYEELPADGGGPGALSRTAAGGALWAALQRIGDVQRHACDGGSQWDRDPATDLSRTLHLLRTVFPVESPAQASLCQQAESAETSAGPPPFHPSSDVS